MCFWFLSISIFTKWLIFFKRISLKTVKKISKVVTILESGFLVKRQQSSQYEYTSYCSPQKRNLQFQNKNRKHVSQKISVWHTIFRSAQGWRLGLFPTFFRRKERRFSCAICRPLAEEGIKEKVKRKKKIYQAPRV